MHRRQESIQASATATGSAAAVVDLAPSQQTNATSLPPDECDSATPFNLVNGSLSGGNFTLSKQFGSTEALFGAVTDPNATVVNVTFTLIDGILSWDTPDLGVASFYYCFGGLYAGFSDLPPGQEGCESITIGAIAGEICSAFIAQTRAVRSDFTASLSSSISTIAGKFIFSFLHAVATP